MQVEKIETYVLISLRECFAVTKAALRLRKMSHTWINKKSYAWTWRWLDARFLQKKKTKTYRASIIGDSEETRWGWGARRNHREFKNF